MGIVLIYSTKTDTQLTDLCFLKLGMLVPLQDFQQSCTHTNLVGFMWGGDNTYWSKPL
jgi:hypothetical protein